MSPRRKVVDADFKRDRYGHNGCHVRLLSRLTFMAYANGYVMCRRPGAVPFAISEKLWLSFEVYDRDQHGKGV